MIQRFEATALTWYSVVFKWQLSDHDPGNEVVLTEITNDRKRTQIHYRGRKRCTKVVGLTSNTKYTFSLRLITDADGLTAPFETDKPTKDSPDINKLDNKEKLWNWNKMRFGKLDKCMVVETQEVHFKTLKCGEHDTRLIMAIQNHQLKEIEEICKRSPESVNTADNSGLSAIMHASARAYPSIIRILHESGGNLDYANPSGKNALMLAAYHGNSHVISTLMNLGCDWSMRDNAGYTALHYSIERGDIEICADLMKHGADVNLADSRGYTGLMSLCLADTENVEMFKFLLDHGAHSEKLLPSGETMIMAAARTNKPGILQLLLDYGTKPAHSKTQYGFSALDMCIEGSPCYDILSEHFPSDSDSDA